MSPPPPSPSAPCQRPAPSLCLVQWFKFAPPPPPSRVLSLNLSQAVNIPLALRERDEKAERVEGEREDGAMEGPGTLETWPLPLNHPLLYYRTCGPCLRRKRTGSECKHPTVEALEHTRRCVRLRGILNTLCSR